MNLDEMLAQYTPEEMDELALARLRYLHKRHSPWLRLLRIHGGRGERSRRHRELTVVVDRWLEAHPTWVQRRLISLT